MIDFYFYKFKEVSLYSKMPEEFLDYDLGCTLGSGAFGKVRKAIHRPTSQKVAIKILMKRKIRTDEDRRRVKRET